jgi:prepilin-type N-terminal cleavage/methylation domain-containing protein
MNTPMRTKGFTLIELLVVIAIIGILSAVVLASLNTARDKGNDAGVKANIDTIATQASLFYSNNTNSYGTFSVATCPIPTAPGTGMFSDPTILQAIASADADNGTGAVTCSASDTDYAVSAARPVGAASAYWCNDNTGKKCGTATNITGSACGVCTTTS